MWEFVKQAGDDLKKVGDRYDLLRASGEFLRWEGKNGEKSGAKLINYLPAPTAEKIVVPDWVGEIGYGAFAFVQVGEDDWRFVESKAREVFIPKSVQYIHNGAFAMLDVANVTIEENCPAAIVKDGAVLSKDGKRFLCKFYSPVDCVTEGRYEVPFGVEEIGEDAFASHAWSVVLPSSVKKICADAFGCFTGEVVVPESVEVIERNAFCSLLVTMHVKKGSYAHKWAKRNKVHFIAEKKKNKQRI